MYQKQSIYILSTQFGFPILGLPFPYIKAPQTSLQVYATFCVLNVTNMIFYRLNQ